MQSFATVTFRVSQLRLFLEAGQQKDWACTLLTVRRKVVGEPFKEPEFFKAFMAIWLGPVPADFKLKDALLGGK